MKLALIQFEARCGEIEHNLRRHHKFAHKAKEMGAQLVVFPELSLTGYEPQLARVLAMNAKDERLQPLQELANSGLSIIVGMPLVGENKPRIGSVFFLPDRPPKIYWKSHLHADESPFFEPGPKSEPFSPGLGFAICYELSVEEHLRDAMVHSLVVYGASVAKTAQGMETAHSRLQQVAREHRLVTFTVNAVGVQDSVDMCGRSAIWSSQGELIDSLGGNEGLLLADVPELD